MTTIDQTEPRKAVYQNRCIVEVVGDPTPDGLIKIVSGKPGRAVEQLVRLDELIMYEPTVPASILAFAERLHKWFSAEEAYKWAQIYLHLLRRIHQENGEFTIEGAARGDQVETNHLGRLIMDLCHHRFIKRVHIPEGDRVVYRLTPKTCEALGIQPDTPGDNETAPAAPAAESVPEPKSIALGASAGYWQEFRTLRQDIGTPERMKRGDEELTKHANEGWGVLHIDNISQNETIIRLIMLQRIISRPLAEDPINTAAQAPQPDPEPQSEEVPEPEPEPQREQRIVEPVGPAVVMSLADFVPGPYTLSIIRDGLDETLSIADQRVADVFTKAYQRSLEQNRITFRPLLPPAHEEKA